MGKIVVKGSASCKFQVELLQIDFTLRGVGKSSGSAITDGKKQVEKFLSAMQDKLNIPPESFRLEDDSVSSGYDHYTFKKDISIVIKANLALMENLTDLVSEIPDMSYSTHFMLDNIPEKEKAVIQMAFEDARKKADMIAECSGQIVTSVEAIDYSQRPYVDVNLAKVDCAPSSEKTKATVLALPEREISKEIGVIFLIEPKA